VALQSMRHEFPGLADAYAAMSEQLAHDQFEGMFARFEAKRADLAAYVERCGGLAGVPLAIADVLELETLEPPADIDAARSRPPAWTQQPGWPPRPPPRGAAKRPTSRSA
jgi:ATP-dependent helicase/nuclease subunit A